MEERLYSLAKTKAPASLFSHRQKSGFLMTRLNYFELQRTFAIPILTLSNVDAGETAPTPVTTVLSLQNLMDANKFLVLFNVI